MRPWGNQSFLNNGPVFNDFGTFFCAFFSRIATAFAVVRPIKPDCYHCLLIHIFVWKKCATVDKRHIAPQGGPVACGHWKICMCIWDIFGIFLTAVFDLFCSQ